MTYLSRGFDKDDPSEKSIESCVAAKVAARKEGEGRTRNAKEEHVWNLRNDPHLSGDRQLKAPESAELGLEHKGSQPRAGDDSSSEHGSVPDFMVISPGAFVAGSASLKGKYGFELSTFFKFGRMLPVGPVFDFARDDSKGSSRFSIGPSIGTLVGADLVYIVNVTRGGSVHGFGVKPFLSIGYLGFYYQYINYPAHSDDHELGLYLKIPMVVVEESGKWEFYPCIFCALMRAAI